MHPIDLDAGFLGAAPIVGATIPIAVGTAFGSLMKGEDRVTMVFFGDGATETGVFHESLDFALLKNLPVVFVCENNLYSVYSPLSVRQPAGREIADLAKGHGMATGRGDGNDVLAVLALVREAVERARSGGGPTFLEFATYRWREHCGPNYDNDLGYRTEAEFQAWKEQCPLERLRPRLEVEGHLHATALEDGIAAEIDAAMAFAEESPFPAPETAFKHVFAGVP